MPTLEQLEQQLARDEAAEKAAYVSAAKYVLAKEATRKAIAELQKKKPVHPLLVEYKDGDKCFGIHYTGVVFKAHTEGYDFEQVVAQGRIFPTGAQARAFAEREKAIATVSRAILIGNGDWVPDWKNSNQDKMYLRYAHHMSKWQEESWQKYQNDFTFPAAKPGTLAGIIEQFGGDLALVIGGAW